MTVYLNKIPRPDILVETGGSLDENEAHVTSSTLRIYMPADSKDIAACDYIQLVENDIVIFAGTVMEAEQENLDNVDLSYKIYNLTLCFCTIKTQGNPSQSFSFFDCIFRFGSCNFIRC